MGLCLFAGDEDVDGPEACFSCGGFTQFRRWLARAEGFGLDEMVGFGSPARRVANSSVWLAPPTCVPLTRPKSSAQESSSVDGSWTPAVVEYNLRNGQPTAEGPRRRHHLGS